MTARFQIAILFLACLLGWSSPLALAQLPSLGETSATPSASPSALPGEEKAKLEARLAEVQQQLMAAATPNLSETIDRPGQAPPYQTSLLRIETNLRRLLSLKEDEALAQSQLEQADTQLLDFTQNGLEEKPPYPVTLLDDLQNQLVLVEDELQAQRAALSSSQANAKVQESQLEDRQALRRRLLDRGVVSGGVDLDRDRETENATAAVQASETTLDVANAESAAAERAMNLATKRQALLERKIALVKSAFQFSQATLEDQLATLDTQRKELNSALDQTLVEISKRLDKVKSLQGPGVDPNARQAEIDAAVEWLTTYQRRKILIEQGLELNLTRRDLWERRYRLSQGGSSVNLSDWAESTEGVQFKLTNLREVISSELSQLRGRLVQVLQSDAGDDAAIARDNVWKTSQAKAIAAHQSDLEMALRYSAESFALSDRLLSEIKAQRASFSWRERFARGWAAVVEIWRTELYTIGDSSVTVGKVVMAFFVLLIGLTLVGRTTLFVSHRLLSRLPMPDSVRGNIERSVRYFFILAVFLFAFRVVNIPLTIFTFLGGTLAIAVGFGAQNILNNFISGLILMVERPVRVGDLIEVDQTTGVVEEIGARSTRVRLATGIHVVLPNSVLLENRVVNWTLTDQTVRTTVTLGVAYGCDPKEVMNLMARAAMSEDLVLKTPEPFVTFDDFADSSLQFSIHFWVSIASPLNKRMSETNLRLAIDALFREHDIVMPFPQRDLNFAGPVPVRMVDSPSKEIPRP